ncbi:hypothetical protein FB45DRAFT_931340 [Roridomyces roridus]|uniref:DUF6534 domain-containing protein n=1 Tax=Roridomyces roridus TaxID=1738132 RepID=A0AAD7BFJ0_9AGAR|nr:hypothetical protein FB45DRAFT_931340 [Roridomyces roridus]
MAVVVAASLNKTPTRVSTSLSDPDDRQFGRACHLQLGSIGKCRNSRTLTQTPSSWMTASIPSDIAEITTPRLLGILMNSGLMGSLIVQVYYYYCTFPNDRSIAKATVYAVFCLELFHTVVMAYAGYWDFGFGDGNLDNFLKRLQSWITPATTLMSGLIAAIVQIFYAFRLYSFSGSRIVGATITWLALLQFAASVAEGIVVTRTGHAGRPAYVPVTLLLWLVGSAGCDVLIAGSMTFYLRRETLVSKHMKNKLSTIIRLTIGTGTLTAIVAVSEIFVVFAFPTHMYYNTGVLTLGKLYSNSLLVLLNARAVVVGGRDDQTSTQRARDIDSGVQRIVN